MRAGSARRFPPEEEEEGWATIVRRRIRGRVRVNSKVRIRVTVTVMARVRVTGWLGSGLRVREGEG